MRNTIVATCVAVLMMSGTVGCKTASKMAFWNSADKSDVESTALAHSAPALPADVAKQAEALATTSPSIDLTTGPSISTSGGSAAPYSPTTVAASAAPPYGTSAPAYPTTGASPYPTTSAPAVAAATTPSAPAAAYVDRSANLGTVNMPYNPNAVPPAKTVASTSPVTPDASADRYGTSSLASNAPAYSASPAPPVATASLPQLSGSSRYGAVQSAATTPPAAASVPAAMPTTPPANTSTVAQASSAPATASLGSPPPPMTGDRYASSSASVPSIPSVPIVPTAPSVSSAPVASAPVTAVTSPAGGAPAVASAAPFRPGGTSSYEGSAVEVASRPKTAEPQVPNVGIPGTTPEPSQAPRYR